MADELKRLFEDVMDVERPEDWLSRARKPQELIDQGINAIDLMADQVRERVAEIGILVTFGQQLRESLDRYERIFDLVRHAGGKSAEAGEAVAPADLEFEPFQGRDVGQHNQGAEHLALFTVENRTAGPDHGAVSTHRQD